MPTDPVTIHFLRMMTLRLSARAECRRADGIFLPRHESLVGRVITGVGYDRTLFPRECVVERADYSDGGETKLFISHPSFAAVLDGCEVPKIAGCAKSIMVSSNRPEEARRPILGQGASVTQLIAHQTCLGRSVAFEGHQRGRGPMLVRIRDSRRQYSVLVRIRHGVDEHVLEALTECIQRFESTSEQPITFHSLTRLADRLLAEQFVTGEVAELPPAQGVAAAKELPPDPPGQTWHDRKGYL